MTNFIRGFESVGDSSACPQSGKDEFSNKVRVYTSVDRSAQSACRLCAMPFSANCECSLRSGIPSFLIVLSAGRFVRGHVARMASVTFSFLSPFLFLLLSHSFSITAQARARGGCRLIRKKKSMSHFLRKFF